MTTARFGGPNHSAWVPLFELILRLKGNLLWPAMWGTRAFGVDDPLNPEWADRHGVVMGTSRSTTRGASRNCRPREPTASSTSMKRRGPRAMERPRHTRATPGRAARPRPSRCLVRAHRLPDPRQREPRPALPRSRPQPAACRARARLGSRQRPLCTTGVCARRTARQRLRTQTGGREVAAHRSTDPHRLHRLATTTDRRDACARRPNRAGRRVIGRRDRRQPRRLARNRGGAGAAAARLVGSAVALHRGVRTWR